ncbi:MAG: hypothetical protein M1338_00940, partial [Patescibacteria group bacterium]|nr:hypothetical protein [Patescibacteria group bacterium]
LADIMTKRFYIVVPYDPVSDKQKSWLKRFLDVFTVASQIRLNQEQFLKRRRELFQRVEHVLTQLNSMGLKAVLLDTQSLIELYYNTYNPDVYNKEKMVDVNKLRIDE